MTTTTRAKQRVNTDINVQRSSAVGDCMVCGEDIWVGIWRDPEGHTFRACGELSACKAVSSFVPTSTISAHEVRAS